MLEPQDRCRRNASHPPLVHRQTPAGFHHSRPSADPDRRPDGLGQARGSHDVADLDTIRTGRAFLVLRTTIQRGERAHPSGATGGNDESNFSTLGSSPHLRAAVLPQSLLRRGRGSSPCWMGNRFRDSRQKVGEQQDTGLIRSTYATAVVPP